LLEAQCGSKIGRSVFISHVLKMSWGLIYKISSDNAKVTIDLRQTDKRLIYQTSDEESRAFHSYDLLAKSLSSSERVFVNWLTYLHFIYPEHTQPFNGPFSGTTRVGRYQKGITNLDFTEARDSEWQWHQLGHMQV